MVIALKPSIPSRWLQALVLLWLQTNGLEGLNAIVKLHGDISCCNPTYIYCVVNFAVLVRKDKILFKILLQVTVWP